MQICGYEAKLPQVFHKPGGRVSGEQVLVALSDIIASKRAANRPRDRAVLDVLTTTIKEKKAEPGRK